MWPSLLTGVPQLTDAAPERTTVPQFPPPPSKHHRQSTLIPMSRFNGSAVKLRAASSLLNWRRFDIYVKWAYAQFVVDHSNLTHMHGFASAAYTEHERAFNRLCEWNHTSSVCEKAGPEEFATCFHRTIESIQTRGYDLGSTVLVDFSGMQCNAAHRVAAATTLNLDVPVKELNCGIVHFFDYRYLLSRGFDSVYADWAMHHAITRDPQLHVLHIWPRAMSRGSTIFKDARLIAKRDCSLENGIVYEKTVPLSPHALHIYLQHAYGTVSWVKPARYEARGFPLHAMVVRSTPVKMKQCKDKIRKLYNLPGVLYNAACHTTDFHSEAIVASQMLFNDNSIAYMHHARNYSVCATLSSTISSDITRVTNMALKPVESSHDRQHSNIRLLPEGMVVDTGAVLALLNLRPLTDVDLVWDSATQSVALALVKSCQARKLCSHEYGSHNPPTVWFSYHDVSQPEDLIHDPSRHGFCAGLKFVAPVQLLAYKRRRYQLRTQKSGKAKDLRDANTLSNLVTSCSYANRTAFCCDTENTSATCMKSKNRRISYSRYHKPVHDLHDDTECLPSSRYCLDRISPVICRVDKLSGCLQ